VILMRREWLGSRVVRANVSFSSEHHALLSEGEAQVFVAKPGVSSGLKGSHFQRREREPVVGET